MPAGTVYAGYAPAGSFSLQTAGPPAIRRPAFGWASQYATVSGSATLSFTNFPYVPAAVLLEVLLWAALALALLGRPFRARRSTSGPVHPGPAVDAAGSVEMHAAVADTGR